MEIQVGWDKPDEGWVKINSDGVVHGDSGPMMAGALIWNTRGTFAHALVEPIESGTSFMTEAVAIRWVIQVALKLGYTIVIVETNS